MKLSLSFSLVALLFIASCEYDEPPRKPRQPGTRYPAGQTSQYPAQPQPFPQDQVPVTPGPTAPTAAAPDVPMDPPPASSAQVPKGDYPYGVPVPGKPGFVRSPYSPDKMTDVRGYAPGTEVKDPYTQKIFLVP
jgi:hypothetical protein